MYSAGSMWPGPRGMGYFDSDVVFFALLREGFLICVWFHDLWKEMNSHLFPEVVEHLTEEAMGLSRRAVLVGAGAATAATLLLPSCGIEEPTAVVHGLLIARARAGETVAALKRRVLGIVTMPGTSNLSAKLGWCVWDGKIESDITVTDADIEITAHKMQTTYDPEDQANTEEPEQWNLAEGEAVLFFLISCTTIARALGGERYVDLIDGTTDPTMVVILRHGRVLVDANLEVDAAETGDELVTFGGLLFV